MNELFKRFKKCCSFLALSLEFANIFLRVRPNNYRNKIQKLLRKNDQESWQELRVKKQTHFLLVFSTINIGFYPQKHCNRQRHHNEAKAIRSLIFFIFVSLKIHFHHIFTNFSCYVLFRCFPKIWHISLYAESRPKFNFREHLTIKSFNFSFGFWQVTY